MAYTPTEITGLKSRLALYLEAEAAILRNQSYEIDGRSLVRTNLRDVQRQIGELRAEIARAEGVGQPRSRIRRAVL